MSRSKYFAGLFEKSNSRFFKWHPLVNGNKKYLPALKSTLVHHFFIENFKKFQRIKKKVGLNYIIYFIFGESF
jgi:hypothetical protein